MLQYRHNNILRVPAGRTKRRRRRFNVQVSARERSEGEKGLETVPHTSVVQNKILVSSQETKHADGIMIKWKLLSFYRAAAITTRELGTAWISVRTFFRRLQLHTSLSQGNSWEMCTICTLEGPYLYCICFFDSFAKSIKFYATRCRHPPPRVLSAISLSIISSHTLCLPRKERHLWI